MRRVFVLFGGPAADSATGQVHKSRTRFWAIWWFRRCCQCFDVPKVLEGMQQTRLVSLELRQWSVIAYARRPDLVEGASQNKFMGLANAYRLLSHGWGLVSTAG